MVYLAPDVSLKRLEEPYVYHRVTDDLLRGARSGVSPSSSRCAGGGAGASADERVLLASCLAEGLLAAEPAGGAGAQRSRAPGIPSLRDLLDST